MTLPFHERLLLRAAELQGEDPLNTLPSHGESEIVAAFDGSVDSQHTANRDTLLRALCDLEDKGWMELMKVGGPWSWQVTIPGLERAAQLRAEQKKADLNRDKDVRLSILKAYEAKWRQQPQSHASVVLDVQAFCEANQIQMDEYQMQAQRLLDQGLIELHSFDQASLECGQANITEAGRKTLDAPPPGAAPTREVADLYREIAHLRRQVEIHSTSPDSLIRDKQLRERVSHLLANSGQLDTAVREAFVVLEDRIRAKGSLDALMVGVDLMAAAFKSPAGVLCVSNNAPEQEGAHLTFRGLTMWVRNAFGHRVVDATTAGDAIRIIAFVDYMLDEVARATIRT